MLQSQCCPINTLDIHHCNTYIHCVQCLQYGYIIPHFLSRVSAQYTYSLLTEIRLYRMLCHLQRQWDLCQYSTWGSHWSMYAWSNCSLLFMKRHYFGNGMHDHVWTMMLILWCLPIYTCNVTSPIIIGECRPCLNGCHDNALFTCSCTLSITICCVGS